MLSLAGQDLEQLAARLLWLRKHVAYVELRLDLLPAEAPLAAWIAACPELSFLATYRLREEGGQGEGGPEEWQRRITAALQAGVSMVDLPLCEADLELPAGVGRVLSWHAPGEGLVHADALLAEAWEQAQATAGPHDLIKLVTWAERSADSAAVLALQRKHPGKRLLAFSQGPGSAASRLLSLRFGAPWLYCAWPGEKTAPGQWSLADLQQLPQGWHLPQTPVVGVAGHPVGHSLSPWLWQQAGQHAQAKQAVLSLSLEAEKFTELLPLLDDSDFRALSLTSPLKQQAWERFPPAASAAGAVNYLVRNEQQTWQSGNSDGAGALHALQAGGLCPSDRVLVLGGGGAARGVAEALAEAGHEVTVSARRSQQVSWWPHVQAWESVQPSQFEVVVQATTLGSAANPGLPLPRRPPQSGALALELLYQPLETAWMAQARAAGAKVLPGTTMLLAQMLTPFALAFPQSALSPPEVRALQQAFDAHLADEQAAVLLGPRASGKTTLGRALAQAIGWSFVDADQALEQLHQRPLASWIEQDLPSFRAAEAALLPQLLGRRRHVVALGGGVVEDPASVQQLQRHGRVLALDAPAALLWARQEQSRRPRLVGRDLAEEIALLGARRRDAYAAAAKDSLRSDCPLPRLIEQAQELLHLETFGQS